jgi:DNA-binding NarL/FixJ family response regulator
MSDSPHILFIDENDNERDYFAERLQRCSPDFTVLHAATGLSGLALCRDHPIDCVVLELDLPDMSGFEVLLNLVPRVKHPEIAVVILTRLTNQYLLDAAVKNGALAVFRKAMTSGDHLHMGVLRAMTTVQRDRKRCDSAGT